MLNKINKFDQNEFTDFFGNIFENAGWIAEELYKQKPFNNFQDLSKKMHKIFDNTDVEGKLKILNSHPDLANKAKIGSLTQDSNKEQKNAGLDQCSEKEFNEFKNLNKKYKVKFGFPFILAVMGKNKIEILNNFRERILFNKKDEFFEATKQVKTIASLRLAELKNSENFI
jgi:OHCU decarboxylase|tara:strand:- start:485 stop:997 length:513 start_codon:yes stop_codon:yes gene_type:complete